MSSKAAADLRLKKRLAYKPTPIILRGDFPQQNAFVEDASRYLVAQCSRRSGKSNGLGLRFLRTMERHPKSHCLYLSLTQDSARSIMWPVLQELNDIHKIGCTFTESKLEMKHPNGSTLKLMGADLKDFIKRLKGRKFPGVAIDEAQDMGTHLRSLIDDVLTPSIADYADGWLALTGTPGPVPSGTFFEISKQQKYGFSCHYWTILDNPFMPDATGFIADLKEKRGWEDNNPTLLREWKNQWVLDVQSLWIQYRADKNHYAYLPEGKYNYIIGADIGFKDADALAVLAWSDKSKDIYLVEEIITTKQDITAFADQIKALKEKYGAYKIVMDEGGLGKKAAEEMRRRHALPILAAEKHRKQENVEWLNDALRLGHFKAKSNSRFAQDSYLVQIDWDKSTPDRIVVKKNPHSDIIDAVLYAFKESYAFSFKPTPEGPKPGSPEWFRAETERMFEAEHQGMMEQAQYDAYLRGENE